MDFWLVICCSGAAALLFLGLVGALILLLFRERSQKIHEPEE